MNESDVVLQVCFYMTEHTPKELHPTIKTISVMESCLSKTISLCFDCGKIYPEINLKECTNCKVYFCNLCRSELFAAGGLQTTCTSKKCGSSVPEYTKEESLRRNVFVSEPTLANLDKSGMYLSGLSTTVFNELNTFRGIAPERRQVNQEKRSNEASVKEQLMAFGEESIMDPLQEITTEYDFALFKEKLYSPPLLYTEKK